MRQILILLPLAAALALSGCKKPPPKTTEAEQARAVRVVRVEVRPIAGALAGSGDLISREEAAVYPEVAGFRAARVLVDVGDAIKKGQTLVELDPTMIQAQLAQARANTAQAEANALQAEEGANRVKDLDNQGVLAQETIDQRRYQAKAARATANAQAAVLKDMTTRVTKLSVSAPVGGLVLERTVRPGDMSSLGGATPWFRIARDSEIELAAQLSESDLAKVRPGQHAEVTLPSGMTVAGTVRLVSPQVDPQTKLGVVRVRLPVEREIRAGGFGRAVFTDVTGMVQAVPETSVRYDADGAAVMVVGGDNRVHRALVQTGQRGGGLVQLIKGPAAGTRIVQNAAAFLLDGDLIKPSDVAVAVAAPPAPAATRVARR
jgi:HlyD family secretion protein